MLPWWMNAFTSFGASPENCMTSGMVIYPQTTVVPCLLCGQLIAEGDHPLSVITCSLVCDVSFLCCELFGTLLQSSLR
jgi:hypothetical protein